MLKTFVPELSISDYKIGDFIVWKDMENYRQGVVTLAENTVYFHEFDSGFATIHNKDPKKGKLTKSNRMGFNNHLAKVLAHFYREKEEGSYKGAIAARKIQNLEAITMNFIKNEMDAIAALESAPDSPNTGVYVAEGIYRTKANKPRYEAFEFSPRLEAYKVHQYLWIVHSKGFGNIESKILEKDGKKKELFNYDVHEIPQDAIKLIEPIKFKFVTELWHINNGK